MNNVLRNYAEGDLTSRKRLPCCGQRGGVRLVSRLPAGVAGHGERLGGKERASMAGSGWRGARQASLAPGVRVMLHADQTKHGTVAVVLRGDHDHYVVRWDDGDTGEYVEAALVLERL
jgi:hypothetical protein